jgi:RNA polymerase sigma-70 factor (ECF subfamily)
MTIVSEVPFATIEAARLGEAGAADRLVAQAWPHAFRIARSILRDAGLAEDAAQEACAVVFRRAGQLRSAEAFRVWFYRIVLREALRLERKRALAACFTAEPESCGDLGDTDLRVDVLRALGKLSRDQRAAIVLHYYAGMNGREIAAVLDVPHSTVRFHLMRARAKLETLLCDHRLHPTFMEAVAGAL